VDLETFQTTLNPTTSNSSLSPAFPSLNSVLTTLPSHRQFQMSHLQQLYHPPHQQPSSRPQSQQQLNQLSPAHHTFLITAHLFSLPLRISTICRKVHTILTGRDARRRADRGISTEADGLQEVWDGLDTCWTECDAIRRDAVGISGEEMEQYIGSWQIFIFECRECIFYPSFSDIDVGSVQRILSAKR
jgi:hypothetical protein